tara:strand:+ start:53 stop:727 length:675 start_codon:yes stop_codon:yes gene_type:complete
MNLILILTLFGLTLLSNFNPSILGSGRGEASLIEVSQAAILFLSLIINLRYWKLFLKYNNKLVYALRIFMFFFIFYEEVSFFTKGFSNFFNQVNIKSEINLHNSWFLSTNNIFLNDINLPLINYSFNITYNFIFYFVGILLLGFGSYLSFLKPMRILFLQKKYSFFSLVYIISVLINSIVNRAQILSYSYSLIGPEYLEIFIYILLLIDTREKIKSMRANSKCQ